MSKERDLLERWDKGYLLFEEYMQLVKETKELLAKPERGPLSEDKLDALAEANITDEGIAGYYLGFRDAEKYYGIGGGE